MTEGEWNACINPHLMLGELGALSFRWGNALRPGITVRKLRLFAIACCRRVWYLLDDERCRSVVTVQEQFADGKATDQELNNAVEAAFASVSQSDPSSAYYAKLSTLTYSEATDPEEFVDWLASLGDLTAKARGFDNPSPLHFDGALADQEEFAEAELLRCIFGPLPFRAVALNPSWMTSIVRQMIETFYETKDFTGLPILADALEDAGCNNADILNHCREPGPHVRGCWVVDLLLAKE